MSKLNFLSIIAMVSLLGFGSCKNDDLVSSPVSVDKMPKAIITGYVTAETNLQSVGAEVAPAGTKLLVELNYADINGAATGKWQDSVTIDANGKYTLHVPADANGVNVTITPVPFEANQTQAFGAFYPQVKKSYTGVAAVIAIRSGQTLTSDFVFAPANLPTFTDRVNVSGKAQADLSDETVGLENLPNGTIIRFYNATWKDSVAVQNGLYSINVPKGVAVNWEAKFTYSKKVWVNDVDPTLSAYQNINYEYTFTGVKTFNAKAEDEDVTAGVGTDLTVDPNVNVVLLSGTATAELDASTAGLEKMPNGTKIYFYTNTWGATATVADGKYSVSIPKNTLVSYDINFTANNKVLTGLVYANVSYNYAKSATIPATGAKTLTSNLSATGTVAP